MCNFSDIRDKGSCREGEGERGEGGTVRQLLGHDCFSYPANDAGQAETIIPEQNNTTQVHTNTTKFNYYKNK